ncbi:MAG: hypothetical protein CVU50_00750 [Candidatus Cloacimonetes bacterium HGW-Cloacimonetes-3]|jgi:hypothetical protein|nr:MAG: hypothetical protein CVU50_00750 [Candidatus Cloacimonetes bacterium HGW-Cloacimonetes-3]
MRAKFTYGIGSYSGKLDGVVFCNYRREGLVLVRKYRYPTLTEQNHKIGNTTTNLHAITPSEGYKNDIRTYLGRYNTLRDNEGKYVRSWVNMYLKLMREMARRDYTIDLLTLTREEIYTRDLPCISISRAVEAGLLPVVYDYEHLDREI